jgi:predicted RNase H-like HicB family nuclease
MQKLTLVYWKGDRFWLGKLAERPEIMTQGETVAQLRENIAEAYRMMILEDVPESYQVEEITV